MSRNEFIQKVNERVKLVRTEYGYTQEQLAAILGISKKTLVEIEKGRSSLGFSGAVAFCTIFGSSEILDSALGGETTDIILALAFSGNEPDYSKTLGGRIWWKNLEEIKGYKIQQNIISHHYRALDQDDFRICASFRFDEIHQRIARLTEE